MGTKELLGFINILLTSLALAMTIGGCGSSDSSPKNGQTSSADSNLLAKPFATLTVYVDQDGIAKANASFLAKGENSSEYLVPEGDVRCNGIILEKTVQNNVVLHAARVPYAEGATYEFVFEHEGTERKAKVAMPEPIVIQTPDENTTIRSGDPLLARWNRSQSDEDLITVTFTFQQDPQSQPGDRTLTFSKAFVPDAGEMLIPSDATVAERDSRRASVIVSRNRKGTVPEGFNGLVMANQRDTINVMVVGR